MIDTIVIRINDLGAHSTLTAFLNQKHKKEGFTVKQVDSEHDYSDSVKRIYKTLLYYHDTGRMMEKAHFNKLKSNHYEIAYHIDYDRDHITFNLSIPKYIYGTNVVQFVKSPFSPGFIFGKNSELEFTASQTFENLISFIKRFFKLEFPGVTIYPKLVEINRIDISYNQVFHDKAGALEYLKQLKTVKKKFSRDTSNFSRDWKTSIVYRTDRYSFKVYHKGAEFKKHDSKQLEKFGGFDVPFYQDLADKVLRYEITIRGSYMSYLYMRHLFRKDCPLWKYGLRLFDLERKAKEKKPTLQNPQPFAAFKKSLAPGDQKHIDYVKHHLNKTKKFYLNVTDQEKAFDSDTDHETFLAFPQRKERFSYSSKFTGSLFKLMMNKFLDILNEFKLSTFQDNAIILQRLDQINTAAKTKKVLFSELDISPDMKPRVISRSKIVMLLELLEKYTFEEIQVNNFFHRNTWTRYKKDLQMLGLTDKTLLSSTVNAPFDFRNYNSIILYNKNKFRNLAFL